MVANAGWTNGRMGEAEEGSGRAASGNMNMTAQEPK
jgi:hypothetical protein